MSEEIQFEKALEKLEKIVTELESGDLGLEDALKKYEEGIRISRACQKKLTEAEKRIEILTKSMDGSLKREAFDLEEGDAESGGAKAAKRPAKNTKAQSQDEDLLI